MIFEIILAIIVAFGISCAIGIPLGYLLFKYERAIDKWYEGKGGVE